MHILKVVTLRFNPDREGRHEQEKGVKGITKGNQWTGCLSLRKDRQQDRD